MIFEVWDERVIFPKKFHFRFRPSRLQWRNHVRSRYSMELMHFNDALKSISVENQARPCDIESEFDIFFLNVDRRDRNVAHFPFQ